MRSIESIMAEADEAAAKARDEGLEPYVFDTKPSLYNPYPFPFLGSFVPKGWQQTKYYLVDSSGFGAPDEPAMTIEQFHDHVLETIEADPETGFAIIQNGQFQVKISEYKKIS